MKQAESSDDQFEVRSRERHEAETWLEAKHERRRQRAPNLDEIAPADVLARLEMDGSRGRLARILVKADGYRWRWPWANQEHLDVIECDLEGVRIAPRPLRSSGFDDCRFERVAMGGAEIGRTTFEACAFERVSLAGIATGSVRHSTFRRSSFVRLDARGVEFDRVRFEDCDIDGLRGTATRFSNCSFVRTAFRGKIIGVVFDGCSFERVDMSYAQVSRSFISLSRVQREFLYPGRRSGFAIDYEAYRAAVEGVAASLSDSDATALRAEVGSWASNPPAEILLDEETFRPLSAGGRSIAVDALYDRRLVRRG